MSPKNFILGLILILLVGLFSGTVKTVNVGASYDLDNFFSSSNIDLGISSKNSGTIWSANNAAIYNLNNQIKKKKDVKKEEKLKQIDLEIVRTKEIVKEDNLDQNFIQKELIIDKEIITEKEETIKIAKEMSVTNVKSLVCSPEPTTVKGLPAIFCPRKTPKTAPYVPDVLERGP